MHRTPVEGLEGLGVRLYQLRNERKLTFWELERRTGLARSHIFAIESGMVKNPNVATMVRIARGLNVSLDALLDFQPQVKVLCPECHGEGWILEDQAQPAPTPDDEEATPDG